jgi:proline dehydrogenase
MDFSIKLTLEETNLVLGALSKLSYEVAAPLIDKVKGQATSQMAEAQVKEKEAKELTPA